MPKNLKKILVPFFFIAVLIVGVKSYKDYGFSYDEQVSRENGIMSAVYANAKLGHIFMSKEKIQARFKDFKKDNPGDTTTLHKDFDENALLTYEDRDYGTFFEMILIGIESGLKLTDSQAIYQTRHLVTFIQFFIGLIFFYLLCTKIFKDWKFGLAGALFLLLSPRLFGQAFYNSKDMVQLSFMIISFYTLSLFLEKRTIKYVLLHGLICAITVDVRIIGILIVAMTGAGLLLEWLVERNNYKSIVASLKPFLIPTIVFSIVFILLTVAFWPFLWSDPLGHFMFAVHNMSQFRWSGPVNYLGHHYSIPAQHLPWHFLLVWIVVSTPLLYVLLAIAGGITLIVTMKKNLIVSDFNYRLKLMAAALFVLPVLMVIVMKPVLYNDWRHFYFMYPFFIILSIVGLQKLYNLFEKWLHPTKAKYALIAIIILNSGYISSGMMRNHPFEFVYFNELVNREKRGFELDYWGLAYKSGYEYVLNNNNRLVLVTCNGPGDKLAVDSSAVKVAVNSFPAMQNLKMLSPESRKNIKLVSPQEAEYVLTNNNNDGMLTQGHFILDKTVVAYGMPILYIYKSAR
jgi:hypothetical protein